MCRVRLHLFCTRHGKRYAYELNLTKITFYAMFVNVFVFSHFTCFSVAKFPFQLFITTVHNSRLC